MPATYKNDPHLQMWMQDNYHSAIRSRNRAYVLCMFLLLLSAASVFSVAALAPLKEVKTNIVLIDSVHGVVTSIQEGTDLENIKARYAVTQSMLYRYVIARETYDAADYQVKYDLVRKMSAEIPRNEYEQRMKSAASPISVLGRNGTRRVHIQAVSQLTDTTSQVRFTTEDSFGGGTPRPSRPWIAIISYEYINTPTGIQDRLENPLGFMVTSYRIDQESALPGLFATPEKNGTPAPIPDEPIKTGTPDGDDYQPRIHVPSSN